MNKIISIKVNLALLQTQYRWLLDQASEIGEYPEELEGLLEMVETILESDGEATYENSI